MGHSSTLLFTQTRPFMKFKMMTLFLYVIFFILNFLTTSKASIIKINDGACWVEETKSDGFKVADFNKKRTRYYSSPYIKQKLEEVMSEIEGFGEDREDVKKVDVYFYCSEGGNAFVFKLDYKEIGVCSWNFLGDKEKNLQKLEHFSQTRGQAEGPCWGFEPGTLFVSLKDKSFLEEAYEELKSVHWGDRIDSVEQFSGLTLKVRLFEKYYFRESELKKDLESHKIMNDQIREVFFNHMMRIGGEFYKIKSASANATKK
tara:strand:+ start:341 stop:1117 length:777 start_codon:yes stop_codon:yes gene_type:complete